jgi:hypothetical protein
MSYQTKWGASGALFAAARCILVQVIVMFFRGGTLLPLVVLITTSIGCALDSHQPSVRNAQGVNLWKLLHPRAAGSAPTGKQRYAISPGAHNSIALAGAPASQAPLTASTKPEFEFRPETFIQPLDHFGNSTDATFPQRYWVNKRHYRPRPGAPVIVIDGGETSGEDRLPFLDTGIADILARATGGIGVVLEHRYYGAWTGWLCVPSLYVLIGAPAFGAGSVLQANLLGFRTSQRTR